MQKGVVLVAGGTGFVGKRVTALLEKKGYRVILHHRGYKAVPTNADFIINLVGIIREDSQTYQEAHVEFTKWLLRLGKKLKVRQFVQMSALGANPEGTPYQKSKYQAEDLVKKSGLPFAILRPSLIFGPEDNSLNRFRRIARTGIFPLFANGIVQPVHVDTVAQLIIAALEARIRNRIVEVGGPEMFTVEQLIDRIHPGVHVIRLPSTVKKTMTTFGEWFTALPTQEQVVMLSQNNTTKDKTVERLKIKNPRVM